MHVNCCTSYNLGSAIQVIQVLYALTLLELVVQELERPGVTKFQLLLSTKHHAHPSATLGTPAPCM